MYASAIVEHISQNWRAGPEVTVVRSPAELPVPAPDDVRGMYWRGRTWVVTGTQSPVNLAGTLAHEAIAHHGMRQLLGGAWASFMGAVRLGAITDTTLRDLQQDIREVYGHLPARFEADEIGAHLAEALAHPLTGRLARDGAIWKMARAAAGLFAREGLLLDRPADAEEVHGALLLSEHVIRHGRLPLVPWWRVRYISRMKPTGPKQPYASMQDQDKALRELEHREADWIGLKFGGGALLCLVLVVAGIVSVVRMFSG